MKCRNCVLSWMGLHPELLFWLKCSTCGWCTLDEEARARMPNACVHAKYPWMKQERLCKIGEQCYCSIASHRAQLLQERQTQKSEPSKDSE